MSFQEHEAYSLYTALWDEAQTAIARNEVTIDPYLSQRERDTRRGLTVLARVSAEVRLNISRFLEELEQLEPQQYYAQPDEFHVTVLSLFTATEAYQPYFDKIEAYRQAVQEALYNAHEFTLTFAGVTASKGVIMVQGFPEGETLNALREDIRQALLDAGLGNSLDQRYRVRAAHISVARFAAPLSAPQQTSAFLLANRETDFGAARVQVLETVAHDWYMARDRVTLLDTQSLLRGGCTNRAE